MNVNPKRGLRHPKRKPDKSLMKKMMKMEIMRTRINKTRRRLAALLMSKMKVMLKIRIKK